MKKVFLAIGAHPDDLDFTAAGTVAKLTAEGNDVIYCIVTNGEKGVHKIKKPAVAIVKLRKKEQTEAAKILGVKKVIFLNEKDGEAENTKGLRKKLVRAIRQIKPEVILSFDPANCKFDNFNRYHRDHREVAQTVFDAIFPAAGSDAFFPDLKLKPHTIKEAWFFGSHEPDLWIDIENTLSKKIEALFTHKSQISDWEKAKEKITEWARRAGAGRNIKFAESFRKLKVN